MKKIFLILVLCSLASITVGQNRPADQKIKVQEVDFDTARTNHRGPGHGFWFGSGDSGFFQILLGNRPYVFKPSGQRDSVALYSDLAGAGGRVFDTIWVYSIYHDYNSHTSPYIREGVDWINSQTHSWQFYNGAAGAMGSISAQGLGHFVKQPTSYVAAQGEFAAPLYVRTGPADDITWELSFSYHATLHWPVVTRAGPGWGVMEDEANIYVQFYVWDLAHSKYAWLTVGSRVFADNTYPWTHHGDVVMDTSDTIPLTNVVWSSLQNGYMGYHAAPWVFGIPPGGTIHWRILSNEDPYYGWDIPPIGPDYGAGEKKYTFSIQSATAYPGGSAMGRTIWNTFAWIDTAYVWQFNYGTHSRMNSQFDKDLSVYGGLYLGGVLTDTVSGGANVRYDTVAGVIHVANAKGVYSSVYNVAADSLAHWWVWPSHNDTLAGLQDLPVVIPGGRFKYVKADSGVALIQSADGDTLKIRAVATSGYTAASFYTSPADKPPNVANAKDDEFDGANGTAPDTGIAATHKWHFLGNGSYGHRKMSFKERAGALCWIDTTENSTFYIKPLCQKITDTAWSMTVHFKFQTSVYGFFGLVVFDSVSGKGEELHVISDNVDGSGEYHEMYKFTAQGTQTGQIVYNKQREVATYCYLQVQKDSLKNLYWRRSSDGITWQNFRTELSTTYVETAGNKIDYVGIGIGGWNAATYPAVGLYWFRYNWVSDFDPTLNR